ncbi:hypothetical protein E2C01_000179 [Portunus trituberculatus]|uniref:Uncharacterized protein n=1 Tax=Portunus trituberculatus TaxID=210409 RepID=A0A5B7CE91_PORTR|nr:hypothetical protein [Portunus trituberculatus]
MRRSTQLLVGGGRQDHHLPLTGTTHPPTNSPTSPPHYMPRPVLPRLGLTFALVSSNLATLNITSSMGRSLHYDISPTTSYCIVKSNSAGFLSLGTCLL